MGDRALIILKDKTEFSPVFYLHWHAPQVQNYINRLKVVMKGREGDLAYTSARLGGIIHNDINGNTSFGLWNLPKDFAENDAYLTEMSHGDGGLFVVDVNDWSIKTYGGYGLGGTNEKRDGGEPDNIAAQAIAKWRKE